MDKRLYKSVRDRKIAGVCGGVAEWIGVDPTLVRFIWLGTVLLFGTGVMFYIMAAIVMPDPPPEVVRRQEEAEFVRQQEEERRAYSENLQKTSSIPSRVEEIVEDDFGDLIEEVEEIPEETKEI